MRGPEAGKGGNGSNFGYAASMSKRINVNPGQYKTSGREHPGQGIAHEQNKERASQDDNRLRKEKNQRRNGDRTARRGKP